MSLLAPVAGHHVTVTGGGPFGRAWFDCSCGVTLVRASKRAANRDALRHYRDVGGVIALSVAERLVG